VDEIRRHLELFVEDLEVARYEQTMALTKAERASVARRSQSEGACVCKATNHAQASWRPMVWKQNASGGLANGCASIPTVHAPEQSGQGGVLLVRAEVFGRPCFGIACAWAEEVQPVSRKTLGFTEKSV
jgi:hypothetical protein